MSARDEALAAIAADARLSALLDDVRPRFDDDPGHDLEHCLRVAGWTLRCGADDVVADVVADVSADVIADVIAAEAIAAALLHDIVNVPKDDPRRSEASTLSAMEARSILPPHGFDPIAIERVAEAIQDHSYSRGAIPRSPLGRALQDADRLEALGVLGLFRCISTGARMGARYFHASDPFAADRPLDDRRFTVDHFYTKLLDLPDTMHTDVGREEARRRVAFLAHTLDELAHELGVVRAPARSRTGSAR